MPDSTQFYFAATAAGLRQEDVERAIELAAALDPHVPGNNVLASVGGWRTPVVYFSPQRLALRHDGTMVAPNESLHLASGHVFMGEWNLALKYKFVNSLV